MVSHGKSYRVILNDALYATTYVVSSFFPGRFSPEFESWNIESERD